MALKALILNGPPRSGKDTFAKLLQIKYPNRFSHLKFSYPLKKAVHSGLGIGLFQFADTERYDAEKDESIPDFFGKKPRDVYIAFSEDYLKPIFGKDIFGKVWLRMYQQHHNGFRDTVVVISDCGFREELDPLLGHFAVGELMLINLYRENCDFKNDSRGYIDITQDTPHFRYQISIENEEDNPASMIEQLEEYWKTLHPLIIVDPNHIQSGAAIGPR